jgi:hypothetical protein
MASRRQRARRDVAAPACQPDTELAAVRSELAELRTLVERLLAGDDPDPDDPLLTTQEIAALTARGDEAVRTWFVARGLGYYDRVARRYRARRSELVAFLIKEFGLARLPYALRNLGQLKSSSDKV